MTVHWTFLPEDERPTRELSGAYTPGQIVPLSLAIPTSAPARAKQRISENNHNHLPFPAR